MKNESHLQTEGRGGGRMRGVATVLLMDGKPVFICPKCGRVLAGNCITVETAERRKNRRGRIAWNRDGICAECAKEEQENKT